MVAKYENRLGKSIRGWYRVHIITENYFFLDQRERSMNIFYSEIFFRAAEIIFGETAISFDDKNYHIITGKCIQLRYMYSIWIML